MRKDFIELHRTESKAAERCRLMNQGFALANNRADIVAVVPHDEQWAIVDLTTAIALRCGYQVCYA